MRRQPTILLTGFGPFPGVEVNVSESFARALADAARARFERVKVHAVTLPTLWEQGPTAARAAIARSRPELVLHFGVSGKAAGFVIERRGANICRAAADAGGRLPGLTVLDTTGPDTRLATLPVDAIVAALATLKLPVAVSDDAGAYLCNAVLYGSLACGGRFDPAMVGFVHIPASWAPLAGQHDGLTEAEGIEGGLAIIDVCLADLARAGARPEP